VDCIPPRPGEAVDIHSMHVCSAVPPGAASAAPRPFRGDADGVPPIAKCSGPSCPFSMSPHRAASPASPAAPKQAQRWFPIAPVGALPGGARAQRARTENHDVLCLSSPRVSQSTNAKH